MWSIGNEIGEADGKPHSLATVKRLVKVIKDVDTTRYVTMGADKFRFGDGSGGHEKIAEELDAVGFNYSEDNYKKLRAKHPNWLIMVQKHLQQPVHVVAIIVLNKNWYIATKLIVTMNSQIMGMIVLVGVKRQPLHGPLTVTTLAMLDSLSGQVRIISVNLHHGTIKTKLPLRALTLVS